MRLLPSESKYAKFSATSNLALEVFLDGTWRALTPGTEDAEGRWGADPDGTVHAILVAHDTVTSPGSAVVLTPGVHTTRLRRTDTGEVLVQNTDPILVSGEATWPVEWGPNPRPSDHETLRYVEDLAVAALRGLTLGRVGGQVVTVMPCGACAHRRHEWYPHWHGGQFVNVCGCADSCACSPVPSVTLEPPVGRVEAVVVNGVALDPSVYRVEDGYRLVRTDTLPWPSCASEDFTVTYLAGHPVDALAARAAGVLASEFAKAVSGDSRGCRLPSGVVQVSRQGITMDVAQGLFPDGLTGLTEVDVWLRSINPYGLRTAPTVWSPDMPRPRSVTWSAS